jgi:cell division protein FtsW (lipid II flippase)
MRDVIVHSVRLLLDELGIDEKRQFMLLIVTCLAGLVVYFVRDRHRHGLLLTTLFTLLCFSTLVFLFTESEAARHWSALVASLAIAAILSWEFVRRRRAAATMTHPAADAAAAAEQSS